MENSNEAVRLSLIKASTWMGYIVMIGLGIALAIFEWSDGNATLAVLFCVVIFTANFFGYLGMEKPSQDERPGRSAPSRRRIPGSSRWWRCAFYLYGT